MTASEVDTQESNSGREVERVFMNPTGLALWAAGAREASLIARSLAKTTFVPESLRARAAQMNGSTPEEKEAAAFELTVMNATAVILTGDELGLKPMASLKSFDLIQGTPAMRANAMRALVMQHGHDLVLVESTPEKCVLKGRRWLVDKTWGEWQTVTWDIPRAQKLKLTTKENWVKQPQTMLIARATGELCRLIASDVLHGAAYTAEELEDSRESRTPNSPAAPQVSTEKTIDRRKAAQRTGAFPQANLDNVPETPAEPEESEPKNAEETVEP